jgi:hypothetical protein
MSRKNAELRAELAKIVRGAANPRTVDQKASTVRKTPTLGPRAVLLGLVVLSVAAGPLLSVFGNAQDIGLTVAVFIFVLFCAVVFGAIFAFNRSHRQAHVDRMKAAGMTEFEAHRAYNARYFD